MQNENKEYVDLYVPRRCYATNKILDARDTASVQISISDKGLDRSEKAKPLTVVLSGFIRSKGRSDANLNKYLKEQGILSFC